MNLKKYELNIALNYLSFSEYTRYLLLNAIHIKIDVKHAYSQIFTS